MAMRKSAKRKFKWQTVSERTTGAFPFTYLRVVQKKWNPKLKKYEKRVLQRTDR